MSIKKLAGQTLWYGVPRIFSRFLSFGVSLLGFRLFDPNGSYAFTQIYAVIPFLNILFTYGLETSYFRFAQDHDRQKLYNTLNISVIVSTILLTALLFMFEGPMTSFIGMEKHPEFVTWMIWIVFFDTLYTIPMARLRQEERPRKYAFINMFSALLNVAIILFFYFVAKPAREHDPYTFLAQLYRPEVGIGYFIIANVIASAVSLLLLYKEFISFRFQFDFKLWKDVMKYSYPLIIVGLGGMINEMLSRLVYQHVLDAPVKQKEYELGVFGANYKLAVLITIFIQIFRLAAEPFFFNQSRHEGAQRMYARVMKFFVIACCFMFLGVSLFLEIWQGLIASKHPEYAEGIHIVPILSMGSVFLGIYYNLSVWYKLTNKNMTGAYITIAGAVITIILNIVLIPAFHYTGAAWATFCCYAFMMIISYVLGQKYYPIPYAKKKLITYLVIVTLFYIFHELIVRNISKTASYYKLTYYGTSLLFFGLFTLLILKVERKEMKRLPFIGKFL
ncbi:oligosaccharide flippase family protein [Pseudoflavitalea sp. G-6-1-2]|uniref:lipopolysaccharide biosynthesis protein n=1 Tax=Pseudoflavitalea sp. G-6-1-2 TaxID=2728841 RepID=UPI00146A607D|nr:polysaccharide biosynthesis C-terminal domain-containing protein [Pseudoflavitalea sp. G-6-1-2]NML20485.1 oligosaccharide flippase family protein [Pseudoflavitalea sp. G-6-1-2]